MKKNLLFCLVILLVSFAGQAFAQTATTDKFGIEGCERHYQSAVKFIVDTQVVHPFSVSNTSKVIISRGNLQYCPARDEWRFAERQFDRCGNGKAAYPPAGPDYATAERGITTVFYDSIDYSTKDATTKSGYKEIHGVPCNNLLVSKNYQGWIDLFAWGTSGHGKRVGDQYALYFHPYDLNNADVNPTYNRYGYGPSYGGGRGPGAKNNNFDTASGTNRYFDWGYANHIREYSGCSHNENGAVVHRRDSTMYAPGVWRTLTSAEWTYLLTTRKVGDEDSAFSYVRIKYGDHETDTVTGVIIYPDDFNFSEVGVAALKFGAYYGLQADIDKATWESLENAGCVFLPTSTVRSYKDGALYINEDILTNVAYYWTSTARSAASAEDVRFAHYIKLLNPTDTYSKFYGLFVRLVQDYTK